MNIFYLFIIFCFIFTQGNNAYNDHNMIITAIQDNGCSSHQELSPTKSNADVYNYAALSTGYNKGIKDDR